jgi:hypothetical protein
MMILISFAHIFSYFCFGGSAATIRQVKGTEGILDRQNEIILFFP